MTNMTNVTNDPWKVKCPECDREMDFLDTIIDRNTGRVLYRLYICHNDECVGRDTIYNDKGSCLQEGDPSGCY